MAEKIPKKIHWCWFGYGELPDLTKKCIESWKRYCSDYEIICWDESNYDVKKNKYMYQAYQQKKWAFVSDYVRLDVIAHYGGVYLDTDVELLKPIDELLEHEAFMGFETTHVNLGLGFGAVKDHPLIKEMRDMYDNVSFIDEYRTLNTTASPAYQTSILRQHGLLQDGEKQIIDGVVIYPSIYFNPPTYMRESGRYAPESYSVHHYMASWRSDSYNQKLKSPFWKFIFKRAKNVGNMAKKIFGEKRWEKIRNKYLHKLYDFVRGS